MIHLKRIGKVALVFALLVSMTLFALVGMGNVPVSAEEDAPTTETTEQSNPIVDSFLAQLKERYGDEYEAYYNAVLERWGSVEEYLLSLAEDGTVPDVAADGWTKFVKWLGDYAPIWASILAVALILIILILGKKALGKIAGWASWDGRRWKSIFGSINKLYNAHAAEQKALLKLLGESNLTEEERKVIEYSLKEMEEDEEV